MLIDIKKMTLFDLGERTFDYINNSGTDIGPGQYSNEKMQAGGHHSKPFNQSS